MATIKFSAFSPGGSGTPTTARVAGFKNLDTSANYYYTISDLTTMIFASGSGLTEGSVVFAGGSGVLSQDNTNFFWDDGNNRLGIGVNDPDSFLEVFGTTTQQKWSFDGDSFATMTVAAASHTTIATGETGDLILTAGGGVGIGVTDPDTTLEVFSTSSQLKLSYDASNETTFATGSGGDLTITPSGGDIDLAGNVKITGQAYSDGIVTLVDGATITPNWNDGNVQKVILGAVGRTMANPTNIQPGATYILVVVQDGSGSRTITTWGTAYEFPANTAPTLTTTADRADVITLVAYNADTLMCTSVLDFTIN